jgi:hypothetical protein
MGITLLSLLATMVEVPATAATFVVDSTGDATDFMTGDGLCDTDDSGGDGPCTLRAAIEQANATANGGTPDEIHFSISGAGPHTILPATLLPTITDPVVIDGYTQSGASVNTNPFASGSNAVLKIEIDGIDVTGTGLRISAGTSTVKGLVVNGFEPGIYLESSNNQITGCFLGTDVSGAVEQANTGGITVLSADNTIGGTAAADRNVISGGSSPLIHLLGGPARTVVEGNHLGTNATGTTTLGSAVFGGIHIASGSDHRIGGTAAGARNLISFPSGSTMVYLGPSAGTGTLIQGNLIGTDAAGASSLITSGTAVRSDSSNGITVGGTAAGAGNVILGEVRPGSSSIVQANLIGTDINGTTDLAGNGSGITISGGGNTIGGSAPGAGNVISGWSIRGIVIAGASATGNTIQGNFIGTDSSGSLDLGNGQDGINLQSGPANNTIGGTGAGEGNVIAFNGSGVTLRNNVGTGNSIQGNRIFSNSALGIDLASTSGTGGDGVTLNDPDDSDSGSNNLQNFPVITAANSGTGMVTGTLDSTASATFRVELFGNVAFDFSGHGEGETFLGSTDVTTDANGDGAFAVPVAGLVSGQFITATATDPAGNTSDSIPVTDANFVDVDSALPGGDPGADVFVIQPGSALPAVGTFGTASVLIDGPSQTAFSGDTNPFGPEISIDGSLAGGGVDGLSLGSVGSATGLNIHSFGGSGVVLGSGQLKGSYIGTDATGTVDLGNASHGVFGTGSGQVGGSSAGEGNVISGNGGNGVNAGFGSVIEGNLIGTTADGTTSLGNSGDGILVTSSGVRIGGTASGARNVISGNTRGVQVFTSGATDALIQGNYIGTDVNGTVDLGNSSHGIDINTGPDRTMVGGSAPGAGNLISGNGGSGVSVTGSFTDDNVIQGNLIGTDANGTSALANAVSGISAGPPVQIGGAAAGARNVVSGNGIGGVTAGAGSTVHGNYIGLDVTGSAALGNGGDGLSVGSNSTVGGTDPGMGNVISGNAIRGIVASSAAVIQGNLVGTDATGTIPLGNTSGPALVLAGSGTTVGGTAPGAANVFAGSHDGISISGSNHTVLGNFIGTDRTATIDLGNTGHGILIQNFLIPASGNQIGGTAAGEGNVIAHNGLTGVVVFEPGSTGNPIRGNSIFDNDSELGIDLGSSGFDSGADNWLGDGVTPNDTLDADGGEANDFQNYPEITAAEVGASTMVTGTLHSLASTTFDLDFYASVVADTSGFGEGDRYLGTTEVITDGSGDGTFSVMLPAATTSGEVITATATDPSGNTSEFSAAFSTATVDPLVVDAGVDQTIDPDTQTILLGAIPPASGGTPPYGYSWTVTPGTADIDWSLSSTSEANPMFTGLVENTYMTTLTVTDDTSPTPLEEADSAFIHVVFPDDREIVNQDLTGTQNLGACVQLTADMGTTIVSGAVITFFSPLVILGPDFFVEEGATLIIVNDVPPECSP